MDKLSSKMCAIIQPSKGVPLEIAEVPIPKPKKGQVLIKMENASINPSDLSLLNGTFANKPNFPIIPGIEGSGTVVGHGGGTIAMLRNGKRVSCTATPPHGGSWAEYMISSAMHVIPVDSNISFEQASSLIVNPLTAIGFVNIARKFGHKTIVNNAAGGALGKMVHRLAMKNNIEVISIVRSNNQLEELKKLGANTVINSSWNNYEEKLYEACHKFNAKLYFDAIGGNATAEFIRNSPSGSHIYLYANLSEHITQFDARTLLQNNKEIRGFFLGNYTSELSLIKKLRNIKTAQKLVKTELKTEISKIYDLHDVNKAIEEYSNNMSAGKILLKMWD
jgi:NADPH:quinone reductase-like Zn-dependent oxidoreductase